MTLTIDNFANAFFDRKQPQKRRILAREQVCNLVEDQNYDAWEKLNLDSDLNPPRKKETVIEGVTFTDSFHQIGYTYHEVDGMLFLNYWNEEQRENVRLIERPIKTIDEFEKYVKQADKKIKKYF